VRILLSGVAGMIASELCQQLHAQDHVIIGNDDLSHNCRLPQELPIQQMFTCSVLQLAYFEKALGEIDLIIHCASPVGHARLTPEAQIAWQIVSDTQAMLELAERKGARLITFSSSEVLTYRGETDIRAQYSLGKLTSEAMVLGHLKVDARVVRPYNVVGRHQKADGGFVMARFRDAALHGQPLTIFGSGEQVRHFTHVSDFARFVLLLVEKWPGKKRWEVFVPENRTTIRDLALMFSKDRGQRAYLLESEARAVLGNAQWRDTPERSLELAEYIMCRGLGWHPQIKLEQIVREMLERVEAAGA